MKRLRGRVETGTRSRCLAWFRRQKAAIKLTKLESLKTTLRAVHRKFPSRVQLRPVLLAGEFRSRRRCEHTASCSGGDHGCQKPHSRAELGQGRAETLSGDT